MFNSNLGLWGSRGDEVHPHWSSDTSTAFEEMEGLNRIMSVVLRSGESQEALLKRFRKAVARSRILSTHRKKRWFVSKGVRRRLEREKSIRRLRRKKVRKVVSYGRRS